MSISAYFMKIGVMFNSLIVMHFEQLYFTILIDVEEENILGSM